VQSYKPGYTALPQVHHDETTVEIRFVVFIYEVDHFSFCPGVYVDDISAVSLKVLNFYIIKFFPFLMCAILLFVYCLVVEIGQSQAIVWICMILEFWRWLMLNTIFLKMNMMNILLQTTMLLPFAVPYF
jgi:hypothetical protein